MPRIVYSSTVARSKRLPSARRWSGIERKTSNSGDAIRQPPIRVVADRFRHFRSRESPTALKVQRIAQPCGDHALCWVHAERLVHKLVPANDKQSNAVKVARRMIWWFYRRLKAYKRAPSAEQASLLRAQFDRIFKRRTGYATLDRLLKRLLGRKHELLRVLERPEIPLNTNASENDIRAFVTKRKISGGTVSENGRQARNPRQPRPKLTNRPGICPISRKGTGKKIPAPLSGNWPAQIC